MGNCSSAKKPIRANTTKAVESAQTLVKSENLNPNIPSNAAGAQQAANNLVNGIPKIKNFKIKFVNLDDSYYPNKKLGAAPAQQANPGSPVKSALGSEAALVATAAKIYPAEMVLRNCVVDGINDPARKNLKHFNVARYKNIDLEDKMDFRLEELMKEGDENTEHVINLVYAGLRNFPINAREYIEKNTKFYATINYNSENNRELVVFTKEALSPNNIKIDKVYDDIFDQETNEIINEHTTICNGLNYFYISGAGIKGLSKSFMRIKLDSSSLSSPASKLIQPLADMPEELELHVMIYVPDSYIFVVGGQSNSHPASKQVYYYDIKNNCWDKHSELRNGRVEHSVCLVNDEHLYAFFGHVNNKNNDEKSIERINLRRPLSKKPAVTLWEQISVETFDLSFFNLYAVGQYKNTILLVNVDVNKSNVVMDQEDNKECNLIFNLETNKLSLYSNQNIKMVREKKALLPISMSKKPLKDDERLVESNKLDFFERTFVPFADNILVLSPYDYNREQTSLVVIKDGVVHNEPFSHV